MLGRTGRWIGEHPWPVLVVWLLLVAGAGGTALGAFGGQGLFDRLSGGASQVPGESRDGTRMLHARQPSTRSVLLQVDDVDATAAVVRADVARTAAALAPDGGTAVAVPSTDGRRLLVTATLASRSPGGDEPSDAAVARTTRQVRALATRIEADAPGATTRVSSVDALVSDINGQVEKDLRTGEAVALPLSLLVMVLVFGGFLAAGIPILGALATIAGGLAALLGYSYAADLDSSVVNVVTVLGLGLCIDYGLLVVSRYREELRALAVVGRPGTERAARTEALERTLASAGRTVVFSAITVAISLGGLLVFQVAILRSMGFASVSVVVVALLVALTLVPALLAVGGARLTRPGAATRIPGLRWVGRKLGDVAPAQGRFSALAAGVQRRPWQVLVGLAVVLLVLASPVLSLQLRADGTALLPRDNPTRQFFDDLDEHFPVAAAPAVTVVARAPLAQVQAYAQRVASLPGVASVDRPRQVGDLVSLGVRVRGDAQGGAARDVVATLRADRPFRTWVTGQAADLVDFTADLASRAPYAAGLVVLVTFVLLFSLTGSLLIPVKALLLNVLSLGASLGAVVWIFQEGHLQGPLDFTSTGGVETFVPPLALAFGFGLSMDYEVFLLSRVLDAHRAGAGTDAAVAGGLQRSGRIITSAALIVVIVFSGFISGNLLAIKQVGLALAVAVAVDATLVRMLLVPAAMTLMGRANWWAPAPLRRLHDRFGISEHAPATAPGRAAPRHRADGVRTPG